MAGGVSNQAIHTIIIHDTSLPGIDLWGAPQCFSGLDIKSISTFSMVVFGCTLKYDRRTSARKGCIRHPTPAFFPPRSLLENGRASMASVSAQFFLCVKILEEPTKNIGCPQPQLKKMMDPHLPLDDTGQPGCFPGSSHKSEASIIPLRKWFAPLESMFETLRVAILKQRKRILMNPVRPCFGLSPCPFSVGGVEKAATKLYQDLPRDPSDLQPLPASLTSSVGRNGSFS